MAKLLPLAGAGPEARTREYRVKTNRPLLDSGIRQMGIWLAELNWDAILRPELNTEEQEQILITIKKTFLLAFNV